MKHLDRTSKKRLIQPRALILWLIISLLGMLYITWVPVHPDEAYYWTWSQHLALSYYDGPPLTAWLLRVITNILGIHPWTIKLIAFLSVSASALILYRLATLLFDYEIAEKTLIIFLLIPITQATNFITSLDPLLMLFWSISLYLFWKWLDTKNIIITILLGLFLGLGFLSKYPMIIFLPSSFLVLLCSPYKKNLLSYKTYLIILVFFIISLPVLIWNQENHWISLGFQWHHGTQSHAFNWHYFYMFLLGQLGAFNPIYFIAFIIFSIKYYKDYRMPQLQFLLIPTLTVLFLFAYFGLFNRSQANWTMPAYLSASILLAYFFDKHRLSFTYWAGILFNILVIIFLKFPYFSPDRINAINPIIKFYGYSEVIENLDKNLTKAQKELPILSDTYQNASEIEFAITSHPHVCIVTPTRESQTTMLCRSLKFNLMNHEQKILWLGPESSLPLIETKTEHCKVIATSQYRYTSIDRDWVAAICFGQLS